MVKTPEVFSHKFRYPPVATDRIRLTSFFRSKQCKMALSGFELPFTDFKPSVSLFTNLSIIMCIGILISEAKHMCLRLTAYIAYMPYLEWFVVWGRLVEFLLKNFNRNSYKCLTLAVLHDNFYEGSNKNGKKKRKEHNDAEKCDVLQWGHICSFSSVCSFSVRVNASERVFVFLFELDTCLKNRVKSTLVSCDWRRSILHPNWGDEERQEVKQTLKESSNRPAWSVLFYFILYESRRLQ